DAISVSIVLVVVRVPLAVPLGVLVFLGAFVPLVGLTVAGALCVAITLITHGLGAALVVLISIVLLVQIEGHVLHPLVMSRAVRLPPLAGVLAVTAGTLIAGIEGALIAVPLAAVVNSIGGYLRAVPGSRRGQPGQTAPGQPAPERSVPGQTTPEQVVSEWTEAAQTAPGQTVPGQIPPERTEPGQPTPEQPPGRAAPSG